MMRTSPPLPILATTATAWRLLWQQRALHARAIWPPVIFLVAAEFLYHRIMGNADTLAARWHALLAVPWYMPAAACILWLTGLKFLLSFSISWRRHLLLGERFNSFFFGGPFWRYLAFLVLTYAWALALLLLCLSLSAAIAAHHGIHAAGLAAAAIGPVALLLILWIIVRQVPFFTILALDPPQPGWRDSVAAMRGQSWRYAAAWLLVMLPVILLNLALDLSLERLGADRHAVATALGEAAFRQAMLFTHFSLGASIGALTATTTLGSRLRVSDRNLRN
jgi:hypothetical protein